MSAFGKKWQRVNDTLQQRRSDLALAVGRLKELKRLYDETEAPAPTRSALGGIRKELANLHKLAAKLEQDIAAAEGGLLAAKPGPKAAKRKKSA